MPLPKIVSPAEWQAARDALLAKEKAMTRAQDALNAERRRLPMVAFDKDYVFEGPKGKVGLADLFLGCRQLIVYHFMLEPGSDHRCPGCAGMVDNMGHLGHLYARDTSLVLVSRTPLAEIEPFRQRMGWTVPWFSAFGSDFPEDCGIDTGFGLSVFLRDGRRVFRSYFTTGRGVERVRADFNYLDMTPLGRQETWEESPAGWPQTPPYAWWRLHDEYPVPRG